MSNEVKLAKEIINKIGVAGVEYMREHGELPAIKLTKEEMNFLNGATGIDLLEFLKNSTFPTDSLNLGDPGSEIIKISTIFINRPI